MEAITRTVGLAWAMVLLGACASPKSTTPTTGDEDTTTTGEAVNSPDKVPPEDDPVRQGLLGPEKPDAEPDPEPAPGCDDADCHELAACRAAPDTGSETCVCQAGFVGDGVESCVDIDECATGQHDCSGNASCSNLPGSFACSCEAGFVGDGKTCADPCASADCDANATCMVVDGEAQCTCGASYVGDGVSCTFDEACSLLSCDEDAVCTVDGDTRSCTCPTGYVGDGQACMDLDECASSETNDCDPNAQCTNTPGSHECRCRAGFEGDGTSCVPVDDCADAPCLNGGTCTDRHMAFSCDCTGTGHEGAFCQREIDECEDSPCQNGGACVDLLNAYRCDCVGTGYEGDHCDTDVPECERGLDSCDEHASCGEEPGGYACTCDAPYQGDGFNCACPPRTTGANCEQCTLGYYQNSQDQCVTRAYLSVRVQGDGFAQIVHPGGVCNSASTCSYEMPQDTYTITIEPGATSQVTSWSVEGCAGNSCAVEHTLGQQITVQVDLAHNVAFKTQGRYSPGDMQGLAGADALCAREAEQAGFHGESWVAFLSIETAEGVVHGLDRLSGARGWVNSLGWPIADTPVDLADGELWYPLLPPHGIETDSTAVWSNTDAQGALVVDDATGLGKDCGDWSDPGATDAQVGYSSAISATWTGVGSGWCNSTRALYCFALDQRAALAAPEARGARTAFLSTPQWEMLSGVAGADALCAADAALVPSLDGKRFRALLSDGSRAAHERFDLGGPGWDRIDGLPWLQKASDLAGRGPLTGLLERADGSVAPHSYGAHDAATGGVTSVRDTCGSWTDSGARFMAGNGDRAGGDAFAAIIRRCDGDPIAVYCLEE